MIDERFAVFGAILNLVGCTIYLISTLQGKTKPNRVSWFLWMLIPMIAFFAQLQQGVGLASFFTFSNGFGPLLILVGSYFNKKSEWKISRFDLICGSFAFIGVILWSLTKVGDLAILFSILADGLAAVPTIVKAYKEPQTENGLAFLLGTVGATFTLLTIKQPIFAFYGYPLFVFLADGTIFTLAHFKLKKLFNKS